METPPPASAGRNSGPSASSSSSSPPKKAKKASPAGHKPRPTTKARVSSAPYPYAGQADVAIAVAPDEPVGHHYDGVAEVALGDSGNSNGDSRRPPTKTTSHAPPQGLRPYPKRRLVRPRHRDDLPWRWVWYTRIVLLCWALAITVWLVVFAAAGGTFVLVDLFNGLGFITGVLFVLQPLGDTHLDSHRVDGQWCYQKPLFWWYSKATQYILLIFSLYGSFSITFGAIFKTLLTEDNVFVLAVMGATVVGIVVFIQDAVRFNANKSFEVSESVALSLYIAAIFGTLFAQLQPTYVYDTLTASLLTFILFVALCYLLYRMAHAWFGRMTPIHILNGVVVATCGVFLFDGYKSWTYGITNAKIGILAGASAGVFLVKWTLFEYLIHAVLGFETTADRKQADLEPEIKAFKGLRMRLREGETMPPTSSVPLVEKWCTGLIDFDSTRISPVADRKRWNLEEQLQAQVFNEIVDSVRADPNIDLRTLQEIFAQHGMHGIQDAFNALVCKKALVPCAHRSAGDPATTKGKDKDKGSATKPSSRRPPNSHHHHHHHQNRHKKFTTGALRPLIGSTRGGSDDPYLADALDEKEDAFD